jgi:hypothetical protein
VEVVDEVELEELELDELEELDEELELELEELDEEELEELELLEELDEELEELLVVTIRTSGPATAHCDSARMMSTAPSSPPRPGSTLMCAPRTMMLELTPGTSWRICSLRVTSRIPGIVSCVLAAGVVSIGLPLRTPPTISVKPVEPLPSERHPLSTASRVIELSPTMTSATLALLWAKPRWPVGSPAAIPSPSVNPLSAPMKRSPGMLTGRADWDDGPKLLVGSVADPVTRGVGAITVPSRLDWTVAA